MLGVDLSGNVVPSQVILKPHQTRDGTCLMLKGPLILLALHIDPSPTPAPVVMWKAGDSQHENNHILERQPLQSVVLRKDMVGRYNVLLFTDSIWNRKFSMITTLMIIDTVYFG